jgi:hypothetical protein
MLRWALFILSLGYASATTPSSTIPVISLADRTPVKGVGMVIGTVEKHAKNPLFVQDKPWEPRLDNGYPNVVYDPTDPQGAYRCWYGDCVKVSAGNP